jgi:arylsulfatase A-like enzyme
VGTNPSNQQQEMFALHEGPVESCIEYFVAEESIRLIDELRSGEEPFFLWTNFWGPHSPSLVPEPYFSMYDPDSIPEHPSYAETFENKPYRQRLIERLWGLSDYGWRGFQEIGARYFGHCTLIDDMVGRILDHLTSLGIAEETMVMFTADHGDCMGAHRLIEKGEFMYDEIYRIPLVVSHPAGRTAGVCDEFVYLHDLMPTILEAAEVEVPPDLDGESLLPAILGDRYRNGREEVFGLFNAHFTVANQRMIRTRTHQFTFNSADQGELYDLERDPYQLQNVYGRPEYESIRADLMERLHRHLKETGDPMFRWYNRIRGAY